MAPAKASKAVVAPKPVPPFQRVVDEVQAHPTESALIAVSLLAVSSILGLLRKLARVEKELKDTKEELKKQQGAASPAASDLASRMAAGFGQLPTMPAMPKLW